MITSRNNLPLLIRALDVPHFTTHLVLNTSLILDVLQVIRYIPQVLRLWIIMMLMSPRRRAITAEETVDAAWVG